MLTEWIFNTDSVNEIKNKSQFKRFFKAMHYKSVLFIKGIVWSSSDMSETIDF